MIRPTLVLCLALAAFAAASAQDAVQGVGGSAFHKNDITYSVSVPTPHVEWAKHLPGGPIRGFFIPSVQYGRDMVELMQRLELLPTTVSIDRNWDTNCWGIGDYYGHEYRGDRDDFRIVYGYVEKDLTGPAPFEVIVIPGPQRVDTDDAGNPGRDTPTGMGRSRACAHPPVCRRREGPSLRRRRA